MKVKINTKIEEGVFKRNREAFRSILREFEGKEVVITVERKTKQRSTPQNAYYFGVIVSLVQNAIIEQWQQRVDKAQVHELLKTECNYIERVNPDTGEILKLAKSTTENTTTEQEEYHVACREWANEWLNIEIPLPNEQITIEL